MFVRLDTCNLRCKWGDTLCDAHYTSWTPGDQRVDLDKFVHHVAERLDALKCRFLVITGGEPTLQGEAVAALCRMALVKQVHSTIETNGTVLVNCAADLICLSPKLRSSVPVGTKYEKMHDTHRWNPQVVKDYIDGFDYFFKFVIDDERDIAEVLQMLRQVGQSLPDPKHVVFMPQGVTTRELMERSRWLASLCKDLGVRFTPRLQIDLWGNTPGT